MILSTFRGVDIVVNRKYYFVSELDKSFGINLGHLNYLIDEENLKLSVKHKGKLLLGYYRENGFRGYCSCLFDGLLTVYKEKAKVALDTGKASMTAFIVETEALVSDVNPEYSWKVATPNDTIEKWLGKPITSPIEQRMVALRYPEVSESLGHSFFETLKKFAPDDSESFENEYEKFVLNIPFKEYKISDLLVARSELIRIGVIKEDSATVLRDEKFEGVSFSNEFLELLHRILTARPDIKAKALYLLLENEARGNTEKVFDTNDILLDEVDGKIVWRDKYANNSEKALNIRTIANKATEVRKLIKSNYEQ